MQTAEIRQKFIRFFESEGYHLLPKASMLDDSIPMSFVMSAGLVQVERSLAKNQAREGHRFILVQDCFRHFDLDKVGSDDFHLSFFEMPGAFKFGSNGKFETVRQMWYLATLGFGIDKDHLWASYFKGGDILGNKVREEVEVQQAWIDLGLPSSRVVGLGVKDNYWLQGKGFNGGDIIQKCGPNTELFYDRGIERSCSENCHPGCMCGRFMEFSNSLFISHEISPQGQILKPLLEPFSETVIGIERVAMILQGCESVFEIDNHQPLLEIIRKFVQVSDQNYPWLISGERVLTDHLKALYLLVAYKAPPPGKNGRERIIKLLIRRIITEQILLGITSSDFLSTSLSCLSHIFALDNYHQVQEKVIDYYAAEKDRFCKTIDRGYKQLLRYINENHSNTLSGEQFLVLEKHMGLPLKLAKKYLVENGYLFPQSDYGSALETWRSKVQN